MTISKCERREEERRHLGGYLESLENYTIRLDEISLDEIRLHYIRIE